MKKPHKQWKCAWNTKCMWKHVQNGCSKHASSLTAAFRSQPFTARQSKPALSACEAFSFKSSLSEFFFYPQNPQQKWPPHVELPLDLQAQDCPCVQAWPCLPSNTLSSRPAVCPWQSATQIYRSVQFSNITWRKSSTVQHFGWLIQLSFFVWMWRRTQQPVSFTWHKNRRKQQQEMNSSKPNKVNLSAPPKHNKYSSTLLCLLAVTFVSHIHELFLISLDLRLQLLSCQSCNCILLFACFLFHNPALLHACCSHVLWFESWSQMDLWVEGEVKKESRKERGREKKRRRAEEEQDITGN